MHSEYFSPLRRLNALSRAKTRFAPGNGFLHLDATDIICERLSVTNREFKKVAILFDGPFTSLVADRISQLANLKAHQIESVSTTKVGKIEFASDNYDLIVSIFDLHWQNDLPGTFAQINRALCPDGLFMAAIPLEGTLNELNSTLVEVESESKRGVVLRVGAICPSQTNW